jgi:hypothetical protein
VPFPDERQSWRSTTQEVPMFPALKMPLLALALSAVLAPASKADGFGFSYLKNSKHGGFSVGYSSGPHWAPGYRAHVPKARWVPGHHEIRRERVFVPGHIERVWIDPVYEWRRDTCGRLVPVCISNGHYETIHHPGAYEIREVRVWVAGCWNS